MDTDLAGSIASAQKASNAKRWADAIARWRSVIDRFGSQSPPQAWIRLSQAHRQQWEFDAAEAAMTEVLALHPGHGAALVEHAEVATSRATNTKVPRPAPRPLSHVVRDWEEAARRWQRVFDELGDKAPPRARGRLNDAHGRIRFPALRHVGFDMLEAAGHRVERAGQASHQIRLRDPDPRFPVPRLWTQIPIEVGPSEWVELESCTILPDGSLIVGDLYLFRDLRCEMPYYLRNPWAYGATYVERAVPGPGGGTLCDVSVPRDMMERAIIVEGAAFLLANNSAGRNFWHFLADSLGRLSVLEQEVDPALRDLDVIVHEPKYPMQQYILEHLFAARRLVVQDSEVVRVARAIVPRNPMHHERIVPEAFRYLRQVLAERLPAVPAAADAPRRLYISRADAKTKDRRQTIFNMEAMQALLARFGFREVVLSEVPPAEQVALFRSAEIVVGVTGAGMANFMLADPRTVFVELAHRDITHWIALMAQACGTRHYALECGEDPRGMTIDLERLESLLADLTARPSVPMPRDGPRPSPESEHRPIDLVG